MGDWGVVLDADAPVNGAQDRPAHGYGFGPDLMPATR